MNNKKIVLWYGPLLSFSGILFFAGDYLPAFNWLASWRPISATLLIVTLFIPLFLSRQFGHQWFGQVLVKEYIALRDNQLYYLFNYILALPLLWKMFSFVSIIGLLFMVVPFGALKKIGEIGSNFSSWIFVLVMLGQIIAIYYFVISNFLYPIQIIGDLI